MEAVSWDLKELTDSMVEEVRKRVKAASVGQYRTVCNGLVRHARLSGATEWSPEVAENYRRHIDEQLERGEVCKEYAVAGIYLDATMEAKGEPLSFDAAAAFAQTQHGFSWRHALLAEFSGTVYLPPCKTTDVDSPHFRALIGP